MTGFAIIGAGFVADLYMGSLKLYPEIPIRGVFDRRPERAAAFCSHWGLAKHDSLEALLAACEPGDIVLNLTNPSSHYEVSRAVLEAGFHVYSEKPLAMEMGQATALTELAAEKRLTSAPCSFLGEAAQTLWAAVRAGYPGKVRLVYAEMDDDFHDCHSLADVWCGKVPGDHPGQRDTIRKHLWHQGRKSDRGVCCL